MTYKKRVQTWKWIFCLSLVILSSFLFFLYQWTFATWPNLQLDELIFHMKVSVEGTSNELVTDGVISILGPTALCIAAMIVIKKWFLSRRQALTLVFLRAASLISVFVLAGTCYAAWQRLNLSSYLFRSSGDDFIQEHYVDPKTRSLVFPEKKKNLIYIYAESLETTFADHASGGAFDQNVIPELTEIALAYEDFSGSSAKLNGAHVLGGSSWTMGAMFSHTAGLPLKISIDGNAMNTQEHFFPGLVAMGDILEDAGYTQSLLIGSDGNFGGRSLYFKEHGNYSIIDYVDALSTGRIPLSYYVWWGYEDEKLFDFARQEVTALAAQDEPFNLTLLTVDTHAEDGYVCPSCPSTYDDQYSNVWACSSSQIASFIEWVQRQDFYQDTVIVLAGDHLTMDSDYCANVSKDYSRKVMVSYINAQKECETTQVREYSTMDLFPTTLSAMGVEIEGDQLGLGVDLFSSTPTLIELMGITAFSQGVAKPSKMMEKLGEIELIADSTHELRYDPASQNLQICIYDIQNIADPISSVEAVVQIDQQKKEKTISLSLQPDQSYIGLLDCSAFPADCANFNMFATTQSGKRYKIASFYGNYKLMGSKDIETYLDVLGELENHTILLSVADEASYSLSDTAAAGLYALGLKEDLSSSRHHSYYAVISPGFLDEKISLDPLEASGALPDGVPYTVYSAGFFTGKSGSSIYIGGIDCSAGQRGINFVIYDNDASKVVDNSYFDTYSGKLHGTLSVASAQDGTYSFQFAPHEYPFILNHVIVHCWNPDQPDQAMECKLEKTESGVYTCTVPVDEAQLLSEPVCMTLYGVNGIERLHMLTVDITCDETIKVSSDTIVAP